MPRSDRLSEKTETKIIRDDISPMCPAKKDVVSLKTPAGREIHQKRFLVMSIEEAHEMFLSENPDINIGKTKFQELRSKYVLPFGKKDPDVCMRICHENIGMILLGIGTLFLDLPKNSETVAKEIVCLFDENHLGCIDRCCFKCGAEKYLNNKIPAEKLDYTVKYYQWQQNDLGFTVKREIITDLCCLMSMYDDLCFIKDEIATQLDPFARNTYNAANIITFKGKSSRERSDNAC